MIAVLGVAPNLMAEGPQAANVPSGLAASSSVLAANRPRTEVWNSGSSTADTSHVLFYRDYVLQACAYESALLGGAYGEVTFTTSATTFAQLLQNGTNWSLVICANQGNYSIGTFQSPLVAFHNSHPNTGIIISEWNAAAASTYFPALGFTDVLPKNVYGPLSYTSGGDFAGVNPVQLHSAGWAVWNTGTITGGTVEATGSAASNPMIARNGQVIVNGFLSDTFVLLATGTALVQAEIAAIAVPDTDGDGCPDATDGCPTDPLKCAPGACGCGVADTDTDGDGTANCNDGCPNDPTKTAPGSCGCGVADTDTDGDGTADCKDGCPADANKTAPGICGCGVADTDTDGDGTADCKDGCPADANKTAPGICGCGVADTDTDGDGTADCKDGCPADANKTAPGICGCGVADTDTDGDGTADCNDGCPADANKTAPGICGCGVADTDSDGDGTADCNDGCPADANKTAPGICGCGVADTDTDGDGVADCKDNCDNIPNPAQADCDSDSIGDVCAIASGAASDCNRNGIPDSCDINSGFDPDCNQNQIPDSCDLGGAGHADGAVQWRVEDGGNGHWYKLITVVQTWSNAQAQAVLTGGYLATVTTAAENSFVRGVAGSVVETVYGVWLGANANPGECNNPNGYRWVTGEPWAWTNWQSVRPNSPTECSLAYRFNYGELWNNIDSGSEVPYLVEWSNATESDCNSNGIPDSCEADSDGDGKIDACDGCPADANKTAPGICGCGVADTDTDGDGTANCNDGCPADANKTAPGICGCGVADTDTDGDGTADCNDGCPADANKTAPGICGCGVADTDTDGDGVADCKDNCDDLANPNQADCNGNSIGDVCDIASGQSLDCNSNGIPDSCDIASGSSSDRDGDGIPGECEPTPAIQLVVAGSPSCVTAPGSEICYDLQVINPPFGLVAGQFFVEWDTATFALVGVSIGDAPFNSIPYSSANAELGRVFLVASVDNGGAGTSESRTVARLRFQALTVNCSPTDPQVRFMPALPQILTDGQGGAATLPLTNPIPVRIDGVAPVITGTPASITVDADAGAGCASQQTVIPPTASDNCGVVSFTFSRTDGQDISAPFPCGTTTMTWIATDSCGLSTTATSSVTVNPFQAFDFQVQIRGASGNFQRCITFTLSGEAVNYTTSEVLSFSSGIATSSFRVPAGDYDCVIADDRLHTLTQQSEIGELGVVYDTSFTGEKALFSGDLNNDNHIDIVDWGVLVVRIGESASVNTDCSTPEFHADLNADGQVTSVDGQLLLDGMLMNGVTCASGVADGGNGGRQSITVKELVSLGVANAEECDLDHNGLVDLFDMLLWQQNSTKH